VNYAIPVLQRNVTVLIFITRSQALFTDKPWDDKAFFLKEIPSLQSKQDELDAAAPPLPTGGMPVATAATDRIRLRKSNSDVARCVDAMRGLVAARPPGRRVIALDAEWAVEKDARGWITHTGPVALLQLAYEPELGGDAEVLLLSIDVRPYNGKRKPLHPRILALLEDTSITFVGRAIVADLKKLGVDYNCSRTTQGAALRSIDIGMMARKCDVVKSAVVALERLVEVCLGERLSKAPEVRLSDWAGATLTAAQTVYAALDAIKSLEVYLYLLPMADLTLRLTADEADVGVPIDIVPPRGSVAVLATCGANATIEAPAIWTAPPRCRPPLFSPTPNRRLVTVTNVLAPSLVVPGLRDENGERMTLGDFGSTPFSISLPLTMLAPSHSRRVTPGPAGVIGASVGASAEAAPPRQPAGAVIPHAARATRLEMIVESIRAIVAEDDSDSDGSDGDDGSAAGSDSSGVRLAKINT
jgi:hypothetical protein